MLIRRAGTPLQHRWSGTRGCRVRAVGAQCRPAWADHGRGDMGSGCLIPGARAPSAHPRDCRCPAHCPGRLVHTAWVPLSC